jgi:hypothetical protein
MAARSDAEDSSVSGGVASVWEDIEWHGWDARRATVGGCELVIGVSAGPRILSLRLGDRPNVLYRDATDFGVGDWRFLGGHRVTVAPESPASYVPDNAPCLVREHDRQLIVTTARGIDPLERKLIIAPDDDGAGFMVENVVCNRGAVAWRGSVWALTAVPPVGRIVSPCSEPDRLERCDVPSDLGAAEQWETSGACVVTTPLGRRGKAGWSADGWLALLGDGFTFVIEVLDAAEMRAEVFVCRDYLELETVGPEVVLRPGEQVVHRQRWRLLLRRFEPDQWRELDSLVRPTWKSKPAAPQFSLQAETARS